MSVRYIQITEADHAANAFHTLGGAGFLSNKETLEHWKAIPTHPHDETADFNHTADLLDADGFTIVEEKPISAATAAQLLGRPLEVARREALEQEAKAAATLKAVEDRAPAIQSQQRGHGNDE